MPARKKANSGTELEAKGSSLVSPGKDQPSHYVAVGASAGGLEAIEAFFTNMPPVSGLGFIVIQHLSPDYKSLMVELLSKKTAMPVHRAEDGMIVQANHVYLIPPKKNLTIFHGKVLLSDQDYHKGINLPIDVFLQSLAEDQGEKGVAIILSGTGSDGMRGVRRIKEFGGMVMVQDEESARFDGMPRAAISTGLADFVLPPDQMPKQLMSFVLSPHASKPDRSVALLSDEDGLTRIFALLREKSKVDFTYYKPATVNRRIERRMAINQLDQISEYASLLQSSSGEVVALFRELLIGVTNFFRDQGAFDYLLEKALPELFKTIQNREIRFWVAGCSTGEEAYSIAIQARLCMEEMGIVRDVKVFATDIDRDAIHFAAAGVYPESIAADISPRTLSKFFHKKDDSFQISRTIREMVVFAQHNITKDPPFTNIDLISCRNLLIYLQPVLQHKIFEFFNFSLNPGGTLLLGTSETCGEMGHYFELLDSKFKVYRSRGRVKQIGEGTHAFSATDTRYRELRNKFSGVRRALRASDEERVLERLVATITGDYIPLTLIVNEHLEVLHVHGDPGRFFKLPTGKLVNDISKMAAKEIVVPLTTGIQKVIRTREEIRISNIRLRGDAAGGTFEMRIKPLVQKKDQEPLVAVFLGEIKRSHQGEVSASVMSYDLSKETEDRLHDLEQELQFTRENLQATIEELETSNEELQATNEELLASNEELQSTNEELQSTNEELFTVNAEYHSRIIELTELHNDVDNLLTATHIGKLLLDENLEVRRFSPAILDIFKLLDSDVGRPITHISHYLTDCDPIQIVQQVQATSQTMEREIFTQAGRWYLMRVVPYAVGPRTFSGTLLSFVDITSIKHAQASLAEKDTLLEETARLAKVGSWSYDTSTRQQFWSDETFRIHDLEPGHHPPVEEGIRFYAPEDRPVISEHFRRACEYGEPYELILNIISAKGRRKWVRAIAKPLIIDGEVRKVLGAFQDISDLQEAQQLALHGAESIKSIESLLNFETHNAADYLSFTLTQAVHLTHSQAGVLYIAADDENTWLLSGVTGSAFGPTLPKMVGQSFDLKKFGLLGAAISKKHSILFDSTDDFSVPTGPNSCASVKASRCVATPLLVGERVVAFLILLDKATPYDGNDISNAELLLKVAWKILGALQCDQNPRESKKRIASPMTKSPLSRKKQSK